MNIAAVNRNHPEHSPVRTKSNTGHAHNLAARTFPARFMARVDT